MFNGLGNQMSQYAYYRACKRLHGSTRFVFFINPGNSHNGYELEKAFGIKKPNCIIDTILCKLYRILTFENGIKSKVLRLCFSTIKESRNYDFDEGLMSRRLFGVVFLWGGWHSEKNFDCISSQLREEFQFVTAGLSPEARHWEDIIANDNCSVSLHVRRGDYLISSETSFYQFNNVATEEYYKSAIAVMKKRLKDPHFYVFSDDIEWCKSTFGNTDFSYIDCNGKESSRFDMFLMSKCRHHINANSTFSWWGAWLTEKDNTVVIVPEFFIRGVLTKDVYPDRWIRINSQGELIVN